jgi:uroporphyrinogen-III synthase
MPEATDLNGFTVGVTADRRGEDQVVMFNRMGAEVVLGPTISTVAAPDDSGLRARTEALIAEPPDVMIANTGLGIRSWLDKAGEWGLRDALIGALSGTRIAARGPKATGALTSAGLEVWWRAPREQLGEVIDHIISEGVEGHRVAFQLHGDDGLAFLARLESAGAIVLPIPVYRWTLPADPSAALHLMRECCAGRIDAVTFTAGPQVRSMMELADDAGLAGDLLDALNGPIVVGCIGPVCGAVANEEGIADLVLPANWRLGSLVKAVAESLVERGPLPT